ncbi:MAG: molecular chaperone [Asticcacaulis sp.]
MRQFVSGRTGPLCHHSLLGVCLTLMLFGVAHGQIAVDKAVVILSKEPKAQIIVSNASQQRAFVDIAARRIETPGEAEERPLESSDPEQVGLLASPNRLVLEPGERRSVRINLLGGKAAADRVWRVLVREVTGPDEAQGLAIRTTLAYDVLVIERPDAPKAILATRRTSEGLVVTNTGNTFLVLDRGQACSSLSPDTCTPLTGKRVYAGKNWTIPLADPRARVEFELTLPEEAPKRITLP